MQTDVSLVKLGWCDMDSLHGMYHPLKLWAKLNKIKEYFDVDYIKYMQWG